jgi:hypothetical protein
MDLRLLTATATGLTVAEGKVEFQSFGKDGRPDRNHTLGRLLPAKSGFLAISYQFNFDIPFVRPVNRPPTGEHACHTRLIQVTLPSPI